MATDPKDLAPERLYLTPGTLALLWAVVVMEVLAPVPALLSLGAIYVLVARPRWFLILVLGLYQERAPAGMGSDHAER